jgi:hypothetical protein
MSMRILIAALGALALAGCSASEPVVIAQSSTAVPLRASAPVATPAPLPAPLVRPAPERPVTKPLAITPPVTSIAPAAPAVTSAPLAAPPQPEPPPPTPPITASLPRQDSTGRFGYLVGTIGLRDGAQLPLVSQFSVCDTQGRTVASVAYDTDPIAEKPGTLSDGSFTGQAFALSLPEGSYQICESRFITESGARAATRSVAIPLQVVAGKASYIGRYIAVSLFDAGGSSLQASSFYWLVAGEQRADWEAVTGAFPKAAGSTSVAALPDLDGAQFRPALKR